MSELDPQRREELHRVMLETADRLRQRGVTLTGRESSDELVSLSNTSLRWSGAVAT